MCGGDRIKFFDFEMIELFIYINVVVKELFCWRLFVIFVFYLVFKDFLVIFDYMVFKGFMIIFLCYLVFYDLVVYFNFEYFDFDRWIMGDVEMKIKNWLVFGVGFYDCFVRRYVFMFFVGMIGKVLLELDWMYYVMFRFEEIKVFVILFFMVSVVILMFMLI